jgi:long-chain acyl-CoA synthetase
MQGYGMSEALAAIIVGTDKKEKNDAIGIPLPGLYVGIFKDDVEVPYGEEGEICITGPNVMLGYYNDDEETNIVLHKHKDGNIWLHSGDLGIMDEERICYIYKQTKKINCNIWI